MIDRIKLIMEYYHMTPAQFADRIGFQRSALSHVLSGRNNPSLDFVLKVKKAFPDTDLEWLALGKGNQFVKQENTDENSRTFPEAVGQESLDFTDKDPEDLSEKEDDLSVSEYPKVTEEKHQSVPENSDLQGFKGEKQIKKIILLYNDGSFSEHIPEK